MPSPIWILPHPALFPFSFPCPPNLDVPGFHPRYVLISVYSTCLPKAISSTFPLSPTIDQSQFFSLITSINFIHLSGLRSAGASSGNLTLRPFPSALKEKIRCHFLVLFSLYVTVYAHFCGLTTLKGILFLTVFLST